MSKVTVQRIGRHPLITPQLHHSLDTNINGPSLIEAPPWLAAPLARYYLYFAAHQGRAIRLALADDMAGPWRIHAPGVLNVENSLFCSTRPTPTGPPPDWVAPGRDWLYPHIASPDLQVDHQSRQIRMYFHGLLPNGEQMTRVALSTDGLAFTVLVPILGSSYFRVFQWQDHVYALSMPDLLSRSENGLDHFTMGNRLGMPAARHSSVLVRGSQLHVIWSEIGDKPERLYHGIADLTQDWCDWRVDSKAELLRPALQWEGADLPLMPSVAGTAYERKRELRDPCIFCAEGCDYLVYAGAGETALGIATISGL